MLVKWGKDTYLYISTSGNNLKELNTNKKQAKRRRVNISFFEIGFSSFFMITQEITPNDKPKTGSQKSRFLIVEIG